MTIQTTLEKINKGIATIRSNGGRVSINQKDEITKGNVSISGVEARYSYNQNEDILTVVIDDKPWLASESMIEGKIREFFE